MQMALFITLNFVRVWAVAATTNSETAIFDSVVMSTRPLFRRLYDSIPSIRFFIEKNYEFCDRRYRNVTTSFWTQLCDGVLWDGWLYDPRATLSRRFWLRALYRPIAYSSVQQRSTYGIYGPTQLGEFFLSFTAAVRPSVRHKSMF